MTENLNGSIIQKLNERLNKQNSINDEDFNRFKKITHIEMANGQLQQNEKEEHADTDNEFKRIDSHLSNTFNSIEEEEEENDNQQQVQSLTSKILINFIWGIRQTLNVIIFAKKIKYYSRQYLFRSMIRQSFNILGDQSSEYDYYVENNFIQSKEKMSFLLRWRKLRQKRYIFQDYLRKIEGHFYNCFRKIIRTINPRNKMKVAWDAIVYFILTINIFYVPIYLSWGDDMLYSNSSQQKLFTLMLNDIPGWVFLFDILLNCITCYYEEGKLITKRRKIFVNYIKGKFWGDIIVVLPFLINQYAHIKYLNVILLLRVNNMINRMNQFEEMIDLTPSQQLLYDFLKIMTTIIFISHFVGCFYFFLGQIEISLGIEENWISFYKIPKEFLQEYVYSIYWATITMVTIGYGDVAPQTSYERIYVMLVALIGCCYYAAILSFIGSILSQWQQVSQEKRKKVSVAISYLKKRGVDRLLQYKVKKQISYLYERDQDYQSEAASIIGQLSTPLQNEIEKDILTRILRNIKFLTYNYSDVFIQHLISALKSKDYEAGETILEKDQIGDSIFCVLNGQCNLEIQVEPYKNNEQTLILDSYNNLDSFGDFCFLTNKPSPGRFVSSTNSTLKILSRKDFESVIQFYPKDYEFYRMQIDQIQIDSSYKYTQKKCQVCNDGTHFFFKCPYTSLNLCKPRLYNQVVLSVSNQRQSQKRLRENKQSSLGIIDWIRSSTVQFLFDNEMLDNVESIEALMGDEENIQQEEDQAEFENIEEDVTIMVKNIEKDEKKKKETKEELQQSNIRTQTVNYFMKKKKDIQAKESQRQVEQQRYAKKNDQRSQSLWDDGQALNPTHLLRNSFNQRRDYYQQQKDPYTPLIQRITKQEEEQIDKISLKINIKPQELRESQKFSSIPNIDRLCNFSIYYPQGNYTEISKQKKSTKYFSKQKFKQSVEAIRKLLVFRSKMENSGIVSQGSSMNMSNIKQKSIESIHKEDVVLYNKQMQQHFRNKMHTVSSSSSTTFQKSVYSIPNLRKDQQEQQNEQKTDRQTQIN